MRVDPTRWMFLLLFVTLSCTLLLTPKKEIGDCVRTISPFLDNVQLSLNCDSPGIIEQSSRPFSELFDEPNIGGSRPSYIVSIHFLSKLSKVAVDIFWIPFGDLILEGLGNSFSISEDEVERVKTLISAGVAALALNLLIVILSIKLLVKLFQFDRWQAFGTVAIVLTFDLVNGWFWVPHSIMANLLVPIGGVYFFAAGEKIGQFSIRELFALGFFGAFMTLYYQYAIIWLPLFWIGFFRSLFWSASRTVLGLDLSKFTGGIFFSGSFFLPVATWWIVNLLISDTFSVEVQDYRQFVWLIDAYNSDRLGTSFVENSIDFGNEVLVTFGIFGGIVVATALGIRIYYSHPVKSLRVNVQVFATISMMFIFNLLQGYYQPRLLISALLIIIIWTSVAIVASKGRKAGLIYMAIIALTQLLLNFNSPAISQT